MNSETLEAGKWRAAQVAASLIDACREKDRGAQTLLVELSGRKLVVRIEVEALIPGGA